MKGILEFVNGMYITLQYHFVMGNNGKNILVNISSFASNKGGRMFIRKGWEQRGIVPEPEIPVFGNRGGDVLASFKSVHSRKVR